jgi:DNA-binding CsgD family transcriptional regulator
MLAFVEKHLDAIRKARSDGDIAEILGQIASTLGYRSGYVIEYTADLKGAQHIVDSSRERTQWWRDYFKSAGEARAGRIAEIIEMGGVQSLGPERFRGENDPVLASARKVDIVDVTVVPVSFEGTLVGLAGFAGNVQLTPTQQTSLQLLVYSLFAQVRSFGSGGIFVPQESLTPREKEVIALSAEGLTSVEIAERLGMSARTVNQHVDNVADKLGTKNRTHTIAEVIRHGLLH